MPLQKSDIQRVPYSGPAIVGYNRLEGVPEANDYRKSLSAEVHDALWMLTRQWQMGEFDAEDAGTAVKSKILVDMQQMTQIQTGGKNINPIDQSLPLEMSVEQEGWNPDLSFRIAAGKLIKEILVEYKLDSVVNLFLDKFRIQLLEDAKQDSVEGKLLAMIHFNRVDSNLYDALKNRVIDGYAFYQFINLTGNEYRDWVNASFTDATVADGAIKAGNEFKVQFEFFYGSTMNAQNPCWKPDQLEYQFSLLSDVDPGQATILEAGSYWGDRLDWYDFEIKKTGMTSIESMSYISVPAPVTYPGMPESRWWQMEDSIINFGNVNAKTTDLPTLMLIDFALIYGNDWLLIPVPMKLNSLCTVKGIIVKDVFGFYTFIPPVDRKANTTWEKWSLFSQYGSDAINDSPAFYLAPGLAKSMEEEPLEKVSLLRDEVSNMAWAFENIVPGAMGRGLRGTEIALQEDKAVDLTPGSEITLKYILGKKVPFYQIPFMPVDIPSDPTHSQMRLQRAAMPGGNSPRGGLLSEIPSPFYIREEEISGAGTSVNRHWQRSRWINGVVAQWIGREKQFGKTEGNSSLEFDLLVYTEKK
jgi:hypothetical protein